MNVPPGDANASSAVAASSSSARPSSASDPAPETALPDAMAALLPTIPRIVDAASVPVVGSDAHLPAIAPAALTAQALRDRFARLADPTAAPWKPEFPGDGLLVRRAPAHAAVLVPLVQHGAALQVLLTRRTDHLRDHAGQVSFPGGRSEPDDADAAATALREAEEEVGLVRAKVEVIGQMPHYRTVTGFIVTPVVALVQPPLDLVLHDAEVAEAFEVPLAHLMDPANHRRHVFSFEGGQRSFLSMPWPDTAADGAPRVHFIWGATAAMLRNLYRLLA